MSTLLWEPTFTVGPRFSVRRSYSSLFVVGWNQSSIISAGQTTVLQEVPFGGYRFHLKFRDDFWQWSSSSWLLEDVFEDVYVTPPGDPTRISAGPVSVRWSICDPWLRHGIVLDMAGLNHMYWFQELPATTLPFWFKETTHIPPMPWPYIA